MTTTTTPTAWLIVATDVATDDVVSAHIVRTRRTQEATCDRLNREGYCVAYAPYYGNPRPLFDPTFYDFTACRLLDVWLSDLGYDPLTWDRYDIIDG